MAAGDDDHEEVVFPFRRQKSETNRREDSSQWNESCYGLWLKDATGDGNKKEPICYGINIVHITKKVLNSKVTPSTTRGIQVIIEEMASDEQKILSKKDEDIGEDGMISYRAPKIKHQKKDDEQSNQPTLLQHIKDNFQQKAIGINARYEKYRSDPAAMREMWFEMKDGLHKQYETGKRLLSYVKPSEKLVQINSMFHQHYEDVVNWLNEKNGK